MLHRAEPKQSSLVQVHAPAITLIQRINEDFIICHDKLLYGCYNTIVKKVYI